MPRVENGVAVDGKATNGPALSGATTGIKLSYTCPAGRQAELLWAQFNNITGGAPTIQITYFDSVGGNTYLLASGTTPQTFGGTVAMVAGDKINAFVSAAVAATFFDFCCFVREYLAA